MAERVRLVLDTNTLLRALVNERSAARRVLHAVESRRALVLLSKPVVAEYREVLTDTEVVAQFPTLTDRNVELVLRRLRYFGEYLRSMKARFVLPRDPRDEMFIELAISGGADFLITHDRDLLSLLTGRTDAAKRFRQRLPAIEVLEAAKFVADHGPALGIDVDLPTDA